MQLRNTENREDNRMVEICCGSCEDAVSASRGGAERIELNSALALGGLTPPAGCVRLVKERTDLKVISMVRPRGGGFCYTALEQARLHDKYLIIDNSMYMLGGRNTMELFLGDYSPEKNVDRELFVYETKQPDENASISQLRRYFETVWALPDSREYVCRKKTSSVEQADKELRERYEYLRETYSEAYTDWDFTALTMETNRISLLSNPIETENKEPLLWYSLQQLMQEADQVTMYTPYIICGKEMYQGLEELKNRGVSVEMITNDVASGANPWGCTDYLNQKEKIWDTGVKVYELMGEYSSHTKAVLLDSRMSLVGSYNFDMRSTYQDTELMLAVDCPELNRIIRQEAERDKAKSKIMGANGEYQYGEGYVPREMSPGKKIFYAIMRVLVIPLRRFL